MSVSWLVVQLDVASLRRTSALPRHRPRHLRDGRQERRHGPTTDDGRNEMRSVGAVDQQRVYCSQLCHLRLVSRPPVAGVAQW